MHQVKTFRTMTDLLIAILFVGLIFVPFLLGLTGTDRTYSEAERRMLSRFPSISTGLNSFVDFARGFDAYYQDHFGLRELLIHRYHREMGKRFRNVRLPDVVVGRDGWFFYSGEDVLDDLTGALAFEPKEVERLAETVKARRRWLEGQGIFYLVAVAPNKQSIYPEYLPAYVPRTDAPSRLDAAVAALNSDPASRIIDLRPILLDAGKEKRLYDKTDTHWNSLGAYVAYREVMKEVARRFPDHDYAHFFTVGASWQEEPAGDLARLAGREADNRELRPMVNAWIRARETAMRPRLRAILALQNLQPHQTVREDRAFRAVVLHDSFINPMRPFLSESFGEVLYVWKYYDRESWQYFTRERLAAVIEEFQPDIVIDMVVERHLDWLLADEAMHGDSRRAAGKNVLAPVQEGAE